MNPFEKYFQNNPIPGSLGFPDDVAVIVAIPVFDDPDIFRTLEVLAECRLKGEKAGVLVIVNHSERSPEELKYRNRELFHSLKEWVARQKTSHIYWEIIHAFDLPAKSAGVGLARKMAMDRAAWHFHSASREDCPIASLDADTWVDPDYLKAIVCFFRENPVAGVAVSYAHRLDDPELPEAVVNAVVKYELYLRYYQQALQYTGHPYAYTAIGSAFVVRASDYVAQGGMNKRQAGEDFYFLQKLISTGRFARLSSTRVYPSARFSSRTPFGTGQSVRQIVEDGGVYPTYHFAAFRDLKSFFQGIHLLYKADEVAIRAYFSLQAVGLQGFLEENGELADLVEINANCASERQFIKRFFDKFNAFRVLKYLNYVHPVFYSKIEVVQAVDAFLEDSGLSCPGNPRERLQLLRRLS